MLKKNIKIADCRKMRVDENTKKCISIAEKPGTAGLKFHNAGYELLDLNYIYFPLKVNPGSLESVISLVRNNFHACSVSTPFKEEVLKYLDWLDEPASEIQAVNSILNDDGNFKGYNADIDGARISISKKIPQGLENKDVFVIGAGGAAKAVLYAIKELNGNVYITNRTEEKAQELAKRYGCKIIPWQDRNFFEGFLLVNATSVGFHNADDIVVHEDSLQNYDFIMDVVSNHNTKMINLAREIGKGIITGKQMAVYQAARQFEIYTGKKLPENFILKRLDG